MAVFFSEIVCIWHKNNWFRSPVGLYNPVNSVSGHARSLISYGLLAPAKSALLPGFSPFD